MDKRPFSLTADLDFLFLSQEHMRIFGEILSAIQRRDGLICVTGEPGAGKTLICKRLLEEIDGEYNVVLVTTPPKTPKDMTETLDEAFGDMEGDARIPVAIFDEAQHLDFRCLDHVKFLTNLERQGEKLLQIILVGQPELSEKIGHKRFVQLEQRIGAKLKLGTLRKKEVWAYLNHRLSAAGLSDKVRFTKASARALYKKTGGVPRLINRIANIAVEQAFKDGKARIGVGRVKRASANVSASRTDWEEVRSHPYRFRFAFLLLLLAASVGLFFYYSLEFGVPISSGGLTASQRSAVAQRPAFPQQFAVKVGHFLGKEQAEELRKRLAEENFTSMIVSKDLGEGWVFYQVRLPGPYSQLEAQYIMDRLLSMGMPGVERIPINS